MSKRKEESDHVDRKDVEAAAGTSRFALDRSVDPAKKASAEIMANRKIAGVRNRSSKSPQPAPFQNPQQGNTFGMQQVNGTSNNMSNGVSQSNSGFSFGSTSQSFPPSNLNNTGFGSSTQQNASFPAPQSSGIFSGMNGSSNSGGFNFNAGAPSNPFANMSQNQPTQGFGQASAPNSSFQSSSNIFGQPQQSQQPSLFQQPNSANPFQSTQNGSFGGQQSPSPFQFGQSQSPSKTPEPPQASAPQQFTPLFGGASQTLSNPFANANTKQSDATTTSTNLFAPASANSFGSPAISNAEPPKDQSSTFSPFKNTNQTLGQSTSDDTSSGFKPSSFSTPSAPGPRKTFFSFGTPQANESPKPSSNLFQTPAANASSTVNGTAPKPSTPAPNRSPSPTKRFNPFANIKTTIDDPKASPDVSTKPDSSSPQKTETSSAPTTSSSDANKQSQTQTQNPFAQSSSKTPASTLFQPSTPSKSSTEAESSNSFKPSQSLNATPSTSTADSSNLFKPSQPTSAAPSLNMFQSSASSQQQQMTPSKSSNLFQSSSTPSQSIKTPQSSNIFQPSTPATKASAAPTMSGDTPYLHGGQKEAYDKYASLRSFNRSFIAALQQMDQTADFTPLFDAYQSELEKIQQTLPSGGKRKADDDLIRTSPKKSRSNEVPSTTPTQSPSKSQASSIIDDVLGGQSKQPVGSPSKSANPNAQSSTPASTGFTPKPAIGTAPPSGFFPSASGSSSTANKASSGFMPSSSATAGQTTNAPTGFVPTATGGTSNTNFFAQFGQRAAKTEEESKKRKKAEEFDSDEDDEAEWERKYEEEQQAKKRKIEEDSKQHKAEFNNSTGFSFKKVEASKPAADNEAPKQPSAFGPADATSNSSKLAETSRSITPNPFAHLSDAAATDQSGDEGDDESDDADEDKAVDSSDARSNIGNNKPTSTSQNSLFSRVTKDDKPMFSQNGTPTKPGSGNIFGLGSPANGASPFGQSSSMGSNLFGAKSASAEDHTWKPDSPVKFASTNATTNSAFGSPNKSGSIQAPSFSFTPTTPEKSKEPGFTSIFQTPAKSGIDTTTTPETRPFKGLFGDNNPDPSPSLFNKQSTTPAGKPAGFAWGMPPKTDSLAPPSSLSRATTPGTDVTSANESTADTDNDEAAAPDEQTDLTSLTPQEKRDEELLFEHNKVKLSSFNKEKKAWESKGTGPIRILKNKETKVTRILLRASPSGRVIMNARLQPTVDYKHAGKNMVQFATFDENGPLTWVVRTGKDEDAVALAAAMQNNKA